MKDKKKESEGSGRPRGSRKNIVGSESQGLLQAAAAAGFIGFSAFQAPSKTPPVGLPAAGDGGRGSGRSVNADATGSGAKGRLKTWKTKHAAAAAAPHGQVLLPYYSGGDSHLAVVSKRLSKRDVTTKLKALAELRVMCRLVTADPDSAPPEGAGSAPGVAVAPGAAGVTSAEALGGFASHWVFLYQRLSTEGDRRTREGANATLVCMLKANRRAFQPLMVSLMGPWWCSQADMASEVSKAAKEAFDAVFPESKRVSVLRRCAAGVLRHIDTTLRQTPVMLEEASGCTPDEAEKRAERLSVSALAALANLMQAVGAEGNSALCRDDGPDACAADREDVAGYTIVVNESLWARLDDPRPSVRRAMFAFVSACCRYAPGLLRPRHPAARASQGEESGKREEGVAAAGSVEVKRDQAVVSAGGGKNGKRSRAATPAMVVGLLAEKEASNHREAWQAILLVLREFKETWRVEKGAAMVLPTLLKRLRKGCFLPSSATSYPCLLPLLASLPIQALLAPADPASSTNTTPFCVAFLEVLWATIADSVARGDAGSVASGAAPAAAGWLGDVVSAHVECLTFLLLKLPPLPPRKSGAVESGAIVAEVSQAGGSAEDPVAASVAAAMSHLGRVLRGVLEDAVAGDDGPRPAEGGGLRGKMKGMGRSSVVTEAFSRALEQLHYGCARGVGVMGSASGSGEVRGVLLEVFKEVLHERSKGGVRWLGAVLVRALSDAKDRPAAAGQGSDIIGLGAETAQLSLPDAGVDQGWLQGICGTVFQYSMAVVGSVKLDDDDESRGLPAVCLRDAPILAMMSSLARVLGMKGIFSIPEFTSMPEPSTKTDALPERTVPADYTHGRSDVSDSASSDSAPAGGGLRVCSGGDRSQVDYSVGRNMGDLSVDGVDPPPGPTGVVAGGGASVTVDGVLPQGVATEFFEKLLVPRLMASASGDGGWERGPAAAAVDALKSLVGMYLLAESGSRQDYDFRFLLKHALARPNSARLRTATMVLRLAPPEIYGNFPEVEEAVLEACGLPSRPKPIQPAPTDPHARFISEDVPAFLQACLGVRDGRQTATPFIGAGTASKIIDVAIATGNDGADLSVASSSAGGSVGRGGGGDGDGGDDDRAAVLQGLLGVLAAKETPAVSLSPALAKGSGGGEDAVKRVREKALPLVLAAFFKCGDGQAAGRLWRDCGTRALAKLAARPASLPQTGEALPPLDPNIRQAFLDRAVERTRRLMEGDPEDAGVSRVSAARSPDRDRGRAERAAMLALALIELESEKALRGAPNQTSTKGASAADGVPEDVEMAQLATGAGGLSSTIAPMLWRLGLTQASVWRERRAEATAGLDGKASAGDFARACVRSRWARRWKCVSAILARSPNARSRLALIAGGVVAEGVDADGKREGPWSNAEASGVALNEIVAAGVVVGRASRFLEGNCEGHGGLSVDYGLLADLPPGLLIPLAAKSAGDTGNGTRGAAAARGVGDDPLEEFGVGLPSVRSVCLAAGDEIAAAATAAAIGVVDSASAHLTKEDAAAFAPVATSKGGEGEIPSADPHRVAFQYRGSDAALQPFGLLLPRDLWPAAFISTARAREGSCLPPSVAPIGKPRVRERGGTEREVPRAGVWGGVVEPTSVRGFVKLTEEDFRCHDLLMSALGCAVAAMAEDAAVGGGGVGGEASALAMSCAAEVSAALLVSVVGEVFALGLGLEDGANRLMAIRAGTLKASAPSPADLKPGAKTLYTRDGQAITIIAAHVDPAGGEAYYTVRPVAAPGSVERVGPERQTILERLSLQPPALPESRSGESGSGYVVPPSCEWLVKLSTAAKLVDVLEGPLFKLEESLWARLAGSSAGGSPGPEIPALLSSTAAALRGCASTCVRAALLSAPPADAGDKLAWDGVRARVGALRSRWASAAVQSDSAVLAARGDGGGGGSVDAAAAVALSTAVLSGFLGATPLMPSEEGAMRLMPARLRQALLSEGDAATGLGVDTPALSRGWKTSQTLASLAWIRDAAEASCKVHPSHSVGSVEGAVLADAQADTEAALVALVSPAASNRRRAEGRGVAVDLALSRACTALFAAEGVRVARGRGASLSSEAKAAVVSWAVSKFLLSGGRMAAAQATPRGDPARGGIADDVALCLETARLLTATAWDGRKGWGGDGSGTTPPRRLVAGARERATVWEAARAPALWRGLHAAVIGAVGSPTLQLCAFEVLEAAAAGWNYGGASAEGAADGAQASDAAEGALGSEKEAAESGAAGEGGDLVPEQSIVTRLAAALGGWGLTSKLAGGGGGAAEGVGSGGEGSDSADEDEMPGADAIEEEAREQQDDLELIARCFPEDLLLAVEALPTTIDSLAVEASEGAWGGGLAGRAIAAGEGHGIGEDETDDDGDDDDDDDDGTDGGDGNSGGRRGGQTSEQDLEDHEAGSAEGEMNTHLSEHTVSELMADSESDTDAAFGQPTSDHADHRVPLSTGKSRRKRLRRRRGNPTPGGGAYSNASGRGRGRRIPPSGSSLTAPFLTWLLWLEHCRRASELESKARSAARAFVVRAGALAPVMEACFRVLRASQGVGGRGAAAASRLGPAQAVRISRLDPRKLHDLARLALAVYFRTVHVFPALSRAWWADDCARGLRVWAAEFTQKHVSPALIQIEAQIIADATERGVWDEGGEMAVRASASSRQVVASYMKEECTLEATIQLPPEYPLRSVEVTCVKRMGVPEHRWRQWVLQIVTLLSLQDGSVLDAVMLWKKNVDKEFEGVEPCVICYGILHPRDMALPQMTCKTCNNKFHSTCLYKWFHTSHKSRCPICQQPWA